MEGSCYQVSLGGVSQTRKVRSTMVYCLLFLYQAVLSGNRWAGSLPDLTPPSERQDLPKVSHHAIMIR